MQFGLDDGQRVETGRELVIGQGAGVIRPGAEVLAMPPRPQEGPNGHNGKD